MHAAPNKQSAAAELSELSERDAQILDFERQWWRYAGAKDEAIRELFDLNATRYYQILNSLLDNPTTLEHHPMLIKRIRRIRYQHHYERSSSRIPNQIK